MLLPMLTKCFYNNVDITNEIVCKKRGAMGAKVKTGDNVIIQDSNKDEKVHVGIGLCKDLSLVPIHDYERMENSIVVFVILVFEVYE